MAICHDKLDFQLLLSSHDADRQLVVKHHFLPMGDRARGWTASKTAVPNPTDLVHILCSSIPYVDRSTSIGYGKGGARRLTEASGVEVAS